MHLYHACAFGAAGRIVRPVEHHIPTQAATVLAMTGGHGHSRVENFEIPGILRFRCAHSQVAGSFDDVNKVHTTLAQAVVEGLNFMDVITADRVVCRISAHFPNTKGATEPSIITTGSHFENLRIAGHRIDVQLAHNVFSKHDTFEKIHKAYNSGKELHEWMVWNKLKGNEDSHPSLAEMSHGLAKLPETHGIYWTSPANHLQLESSNPKTCDLTNFGSVIRVPKFGVVHLAELLIQKGQRRLTMLRVKLGSPAGGDASFADGSGNGTQYPPPG
ncbi:MAG TPA: hypothetical protein VEW69_05115 [Alphaproteobacteria bacterium]|nr:hypothetical protein [Alphaproteobacteria bacterium]